MDRTTSVSPSPSRRFSLQNKIAALGAKFSRTLSLSGDETTTLADSDTRSISTIGSTAHDRSQSRGREVFSSGRGGAGNIRQASASREARSPITDGPDDFSVVRGREPHPSVVNPRSFSTGRGGVGNIRSPSRDVQQSNNNGNKSTNNNNIAEDEIIRAHIAATQDVPHSSGRGGAGNISTSRSRSRGPVTPVTPGTPNAHAHAHVLGSPTAAAPGTATGTGLTSPHVVALPPRSTGRGGAGNIIEETTAEEEMDEDERKRHALLHAQQHRVHSTGRGGSANLTSAPAPEIESLHPRHAEYESRGRGGAGNIVLGRDA